MGIAFLIRHSERNHIINPREHTAELLNEKGKKEAINRGIKLSKIFNSIVIYSSPINRCIQTGECIAQSFGNDINIHKSNILGEPGPFVFGDAMETFESLTTKGVVDSMIKRKQLPFIRSIDEGSKILLDFIQKETNRYDSNAAVIFISHDAIIAPFINFLTHEKFNQSHWIEFLGGIKISFNSKDKDRTFQFQRIYGVEKCRFKKNHSH